MQNVQYAPVPTGTRSATDVPTTCLVSPPLSSASANISSTHPTHASDASHVCVGTFSSRSSLLNSAEQSGPVATMDSTDAMYVMFAATMNATFWTM